ncbi:MAG: hypothetical protein JNJ60_16665, partial [Rhodocyclaceae bacterium]|nr:hypothetical protein [Rhodocyclaceae bacterium]
SLRGLVLPVGGIRDKVLAAMRAGIARVALPARNRRELDAVPEAARARLEFLFLDTVDDAMRACFEPAPAAPAAAPAPAAPAAPAPAARRRGRV